LGLRTIARTLENDQASFRRSDTDLADVKESSHEK